MSTNKVEYVILLFVKGHFIRKIIFLFTLMLVFPVSGFSQGHHVSKKDMMNYNGRKLSKANNNFIVTGIKVDKKETEEVITFTIFFNDVIDTASLDRENILINNHTLKEDVIFLFNKNRNIMQFSVLSQEYQIDNNFSLEIKGIESYDKRIMQVLEIDDLNEGMLVRTYHKDRHKEKR